MTDVPFLGPQESVAGYYIVDCADMERSVEIAGKLGRHHYGRSRYVGPALNPGVR